MRNPSLQHLRSSSRQRSERRNQDRRKVNSPFGSKEWIEAVKAKYAFWPKYDRREDERRSARRRLKQTNRVASRYQELSITDEERQMLVELTGRRN